MYSYTFDEETGGLLLNSTPTVFSKEPRPVYAAELDLLGFDKYWNYDKQNDIPYMWAEAVNYYYYGKLVAKLSGGDLYHAPKIIIPTDESGKFVTPVPTGEYLKPIDIVKMTEKNKEIMDIIEGTTIKKIVNVYEKYKNKLDIFHVAFSGGKDSAVLLDLVQRALPKKSFVVIFGDTGMEFPDTYKIVSETKKICEEEGIAFYEAKSHFKPEESWHMFGPPARVLRWCCSVHKSTPQTLKLREITGKNDSSGLAFVGVRHSESAARSEYEYENKGKKIKGQYSHNPILEWTSAEIWLYMFEKNIKINEAYKKGNSRAGCLLCPMGGGLSNYTRSVAYKDEINQYIGYIKDAYIYTDSNKTEQYINNGGWNARNNGRDLNISKNKYIERVQKGKLIIEIKTLSTDWKEWLKTIENIPFNYKVIKMADGYKIECDEQEIKKYPKIVKRFKQIFKKTSYCVGCRVCEANCRNGSISFLNGLKITNCQHCGNCFEIDDACIAYHSLRTATGEGFMKKSLNTFVDFPPKTEWIQSFFDLKDDFFEYHTLGPMMLSAFKRFLKDSNLIIDGKYSAFAEVIEKIGWRRDVALGLILTNLAAQNPQIEWYVKNLDLNYYYSKEDVEDRLVLYGAKPREAKSIIRVFEKLCNTPFGTSLGFGYVSEDGAIARTKCSISDSRDILYALYVFSESCNQCKEFTLAWLMNDSIEKEGVSPSRLFGLDYEEMKSKLMGLTERYPDFINATFTNDLDKISLTNKTSQNVLELFKED